MTDRPDLSDVAAFAAYVQQLLEPLVPAFERTADLDARSDRVAAVEELPSGHAATVQRARAFQAALFDCGLAWPHGPREFGGLGLTVHHTALLEEVIDDLQLPSREALFVGLNIVAPAILHHGSAELRAEFLPALYRADLIGCQLFSEPGAGSDLASVSTRAVRDGDDWIVSGQKVWTSMGHIADVGEALVRTDDGAQKHAGLSMFLIDMDSPGVTVRPIRQMTGGAAFNEVFLDDVRVPDRRRIGDEGEGWRVASTSLGSERSTMSGSAGPLTPFVLQRLTTLLRNSGGEVAHADQVARMVEAVTAMRAAASLTPGSWSHHLEPVSGSVLKMLMADAADEISTLAHQVIGEAAAYDSGVPDTFAWTEFMLGVPALHIAGGTDEIQRNVIAQRGLGLPRRPRSITP